MDATKTTAVSESPAPYDTSRDLRCDDDHVELAAAYARKMWSGLAWAIGGIVVTAATYSAASSGGTYVVAWGAVVFGAFDFLRGLFGWLRYRA